MEYGESLIWSDLEKSDSQNLELNYPKSSPSPPTTLWAGYFQLPHGSVTIITPIWVLPRKSLSAVFRTLDATMNKRLQNGLCNRMISHGQRVLKMHSSHISDLTRLFLWSKLLAKNTNFKEWEFSAVVRELFSRLYMVSNMREVKSNFNPLFTPWCPVWVVFRVSPTPPFLFMSAMPD